MPRAWKISSHLIFKLKHHEIVTIIILTSQEEPQPRKMLSENGGPDWLVSALGMTWKNAQWERWFFRISDVWWSQVGSTTEAHDHTASQWQRQGSNPVLRESKAYRLLSTTLQFVKIFKLLRIRAYLFFRASLSQIAVLWYIADVK